jgi:CubicO group peptidase (beta-lactamase class C family)
MVEQVGFLPQLYPLGEFWSYNNSGFYLAGRVIEVLTGLSFETALKQYVLAPLGLNRAFFFPEDILLERFAAGHEVIDKQVAVARPWAVPRSVAPAGGLVTDIPTLLRYARYQMGEWDDFERHIFSLERLKEMQQPLLPATGFSHMGLSWWIDEFDGVKIIRHGGGTKGQIAHLAIVPEKRFALAILTNCEEADPLILAIRKQAFQSYLGISFPKATPLKLPISETAEFFGEYHSAMNTLVLSSTEDGLLLQDIPKGGFPTPDTLPGPMPPAARLAFYSADNVIGLEEPYLEARGEFLRDSSGKVAWLRLGGRVHRRQ